MTAALRALPEYLPSNMTEEEFLMVEARDKLETLRENWDTYAELAHDEERDWASAQKLVEESFDSLAEVVDP